MDAEKLASMQAHLDQLQEESAYDLMALLAPSASALRELNPNQRRLWIADVLDELYDEQGGLCPLCGKRLDRANFDVDHKIPFCYGGGNERGNIQLTHGSCNRRKQKAVSPHDLLNYLEDRLMNRPKT